MNDDNENYRTMAVGVDGLLTAERAAWEAVYPNMVPAYEAVHTELTNLGKVRVKLSGMGGSGSTNEKETAEEAALDAAMKVVKGLRTVRRGLTGEVPAELTKAAQWERSVLDDLRDTLLVDALKAIREAARPHEMALVNERVSAGHLTKLETTTATYEGLATAPRKEIVDAVTLRKQERGHVTKLRNELMPQLDEKMDNLEEDLPELVARYRQLRVLVDTGGGSSQN